MRHSATSLYSRLSTASSRVDHGAFYLPEASHRMPLCAPTPIAGIQQQILRRIKELVDAALHNEYRALDEPLKASASAIADQCELANGLSATFVRDQKSLWSRPEFREAYTIRRDWDYGDEAYGDL